MKLFDVILDILFPPVCRVCSQKADMGKNLCSSCYGLFIKESFFACPICGKTAVKCNCRSEFSDFTQTEIAEKSFYSLTFYLGSKAENSDRATEKMIFALKKDGVLEDIFAERLACGLRTLFDSAGESMEEWIITYPPRSEKNLIEYGFDQCEILAKALSKKLGIPYKKTLVRRSGGEQKKLNSAERRRNSSTAYDVKRGTVESGRKYILVDDIITTGSTVVAAARILRFYGAAEVFPVSIARTVYDKQKRQR